MRLWRPLRAVACAAVLLVVIPQLARAHPNAPHAPVATVRGPALVDVSWVVPHHTRGIVGYEVRCNGRLCARVRGARSVHALVRRLRPSTRYRIAVRAMGRAGARSRRTTRRAVTTPAVRAWWRPTVSDTWRIQYEGTLDTSLPGATVYDLDYESTTAQQVRDLHAAGAHVVCYIDAGTWESYRSDANAYPRSILGLVVDGWPQERWVDIRRLDGPVGPTHTTLRHLLAARVDMCRAKGFDGVDPDWQHGYQERTGFPLTASGQLSFNRYLAALAHGRGMAAGLKNDKEQTAALVRFVDFGVDEECQQWNECLGRGIAGDPGWTPFIAATRPVLDVEYTDQRSHCSTITGMYSILKHRNLDAWVRTCPV